MDESYESTHQARKRKVNVSWRRVVRTSKSKAEVMAQQRNETALKDPEFKRACKKVGLATITKRQASKWARKTGLAWKEGRVKK